MTTMIAFVTHSAAPSGAELFVARVAAVMRRVTPVVVLGERGPLEALLRERGIEHVVIPLAASASGVRAEDTGLRRAVAAGGATVSVTVRLARWLRRRRIDVVTTHSAKAHLYGTAAARIAGIPAVAHVHDLVGGPGRDGLGTRVLGWALATGPRAVIANSATTCASLPVRARRRAAVIGCPATVERARPAGSRLRRFTHIGRLAEWKGQDIAVRAFARARRLGLAPDVRLTFVGAPLFAADRAYADELEALVSTLGLDDVVDFGGHRSDMDAVYADADVVLHTSRRPEPFGQVVVEALAAGRPVIAADAGGPAEVLTHDVDGILTRPEDIDALATAMVRVAADGALRERLITAGLTSARALRPERVAEQIEDVLLGTIG